MTGIVTGTVKINKPILYKKSLFPCTYNLFYNNYI